MFGCFEKLDEILNKINLIESKSVKVLYSFVLEEKLKINYTNSINILKNHLEKIKKAANKYFIFFSQYIRKILKYIFSFRPTILETESPILNDFTERMYKFLFSFI